MAYLDLDNHFAAPGVSRTPSGTALSSLANGFSSLEWNVVLLARRDTVRSLAPPRLLARVLAAVSGRPSSSPLADPQLEALRRLAVHAWRRGFALPVAEVERFLAAGYSNGQVETLVRSVVERQRAA